MSSTTSSAAIHEVIVIVIIAGIFILRRRRVGTVRKKNNLEKNQRTSYLARQWLDPVIELVIVGGVIWGDLQHGWLPWLVLLVGLAIGFPIGFIRGKYMYIGSIKGTGKVILERNMAEIGILVALIIVKTIAEHLHAKPTSPLILIVVGALGLSLASSVGRVVYITIRHHKSDIGNDSTKPELSKK